LRRAVSFYLLTFLVFGLLIALGLQVGRSLEAPGVQSAVGQAGPAAPAAVASGGGLGLGAKLAENLGSQFGRLLLQLLAIVLAARLFGALFARLGQPSVIGEIFAGIVLGPSVFGGLAPGAFTFFFAPASLGTLKLLSEVGVVLFLFVIGLELDLTDLRRRAQTAVMVSHASILVPYSFGVLLSLALYTAYAPAGVAFSSFALFMGIAMSITAFPVLARVLEERGLAKTALGTTALAAAAVGDVTAWILLAVVVALVRSAGVASALPTLLLTLTFIAVMWLVVRPLVRRWSDRSATEPGKRVISGVLVLLFASALATEAIGIHALFGAFVAGLVMPASPRFRAFLVERLESFSSVFLLPLFFAFTGLRTQIGLLDDVRSWLVCLLVIAVATLGKLGGTLFAARWTRMSWADSFSLGALMNTRGLMELIALNLGYELGILSPRMFAMLVLMALVTTCLTGPLLSLGQRWGGAAVPAVVGERTRNPGG
jgi:Kef-type K+ transport system membrane component KefB